MNGGLVDPINCPYVSTIASYNCITNIQLMSLINGADGRSAAALTGRSPMRSERSRSMLSQAGSAHAMSDSDSEISSCQGDEGSPTTPSGPTLGRVPTPETEFHSFAFRYVPLNRVNPIFALMCLSFVGLNDCTVVSMILCCMFNIFYALLQ